ncbi:hypothetical protein [Nitrosomonas sp. ANs5]|uniref:hypothetical protein n=1 Tax=Nitrosomonas sp. ANs5 TaxID=3423941 RepID=UPI003D33C01F
MIEKSISTSLALATIAILGQPPRKLFGNTGRSIMQQHNASLYARLFLTTISNHPAT